MANKSYERFGIEPSTPVSKLRRFLAHQIQHRQQINHEERESIESPYFKTEIAASNEKNFEKRHFISSLITKIKSVERSSNKSSISKPYSINEPSQVNIYSHNYKFRGYYSNKQEQKGSGTRFTTEYKPNYETKQTKQDLQELQQQNLILKQKMTELIIENEKLKIQISQIKNSIQVNVIKQASSKQPEKAVNQNQTLLLSFQSFDASNQRQILKNNSLQMSFSNIKFHKQHKLSLINVVDQYVLPTQNQDLARARTQIKQLKHQNVELQKKYMAALKQYRKKKEEEIEIMKKGFTSNLSYYKQLILKISTKAIAPEFKKYQQETSQSVIFQSSLFDESDEIL